VNNIKKENDILNEDRFQINKIIKIKRLKIGMVTAIIAGTLFIASQSFILINQNWFTAARHRLSIDYDNGIIDYDEYRERREQLELDLYTNMWTVSILSTVAKVGVYITFVFITIYLIAIVLDESFNRKTRRLALGLSGIFIIFILYPVIFTPSPPVYYGP